MRYLIYFWSIDFDMKLAKSSYLFLLFIMCSFGAGAQNKAIGSWSSLMSYNVGLGVATDGNILYAISKDAFFTVNTLTTEVIGYSKVNGMSDIGMEKVAYDMATKTAILVYANGNIDLFKDNSFTNIPDLKLKTVAGAKDVNDIYTENGKAYLSTSLGVLVIDLSKENISETYQFYNGSQLQTVTSFIGSGSYFYTVTSSGLYRAPKNSLELQNFQIWKRIDSTHNFSTVKALNNKLFLCDDSTVYTLQSDTAKAVFHAKDISIVNLNPGNNALFIGEFHPYSSKVHVMDSTYNIIDSFFFYDKVKQVVQLIDNSVWLADEYTGLNRRMDTAYRTRMGYFNPSGPGDVTSFDIYAHNHEIYVAHGGYNQSYLALGNGNGISTFVDGKWKQYKRDINYPYFPFSDTIADFVTITKSEKDGTIYAGSFGSGLFELHTDQTFKIYKQGSVLDHSIPNGVNNYPVIGTAIDKDENLWVTMFGSYNELNVKEAASGNWYKFHLPYSRPAYENAGGPMVFDDAGHVWYASAFGGGVIGYNTNNTLSDASDDVSTHLVTAVGYGNLPSSAVKCLAHDKSDNIWIGSSDGIGILYNASNCLNRNDHCDAEIPIVQYDKFAGYFFKDQSVNAIAVDGANRKWIGTDNGVWLLSPDAGNSSIIYRFTVDNSPLPSNRIQKIAIDGVTGEVYIGTEQGMVSFHGSATEGGTQNETVVTYPNPVPSGYKGTIAIKGLVANADVRITDINGQLVYRTTALGGQAVWNGMDYKGHRPASGVYLVFATNSDGTQTYAGKMVFLQ